MQAMTDQSRFVRNTQFSRMSPHSQNHCFCLKNSFIGMHRLYRPLQMNAIHFNDFCFCPKALCPLLHFFSQRETINARLKTGIIINLCCQGHLSAR